MYIASSFIASSPLIFLYASTRSVVFSYISSHCFLLYKNNPLLCVCLSNKYTFHVAIQRFGESNMFSFWDLQLYSVVLFFSKLNPPPTLVLSYLDPPQSSWSMYSHAQFLSLLLLSSFFFIPQEIPFIAPKNRCPPPQTQPNFSIRSTSHPSRATISWTFFRFFENYISASQ